MDQFEGIKFQTKFVFDPISSLVF